MASNNRTYYPIKCYGSLSDGFSGWYAVSDPSLCNDYCYWNPTSENFTKFDRFNSNNPHAVTEMEGAFWTCILNADDPKVNWGNAMITNRGYFGDKFDYLRCNRGVSELVEEGIVEDPSFWGILLVIAVFLAVLFVFAYFRWAKRGGRFGLRREELNLISPETVELRGVNAGAEVDSESKPLPLPFASLSFVEKTKHGLKKTATVASITVLPLTILAVTLISTLSLLELRGGLYLSRFGWLTPACSRSENVCEVSNRDIQQNREAANYRSHDEEPFSYIIASDAQLNWFAGESVSLGIDDLPKICSTSIDSCSECTEKVGRHTNEEQIAAMSSLSLRDTNLKTLVMNGDLTSYFHPTERENYESLYHNIPGIDYYFPSLGNHDYSHAKGAKYGGDQWGFGEAKCNTEHGIAYFKGGLCGRIQNFYISRITSYDAASLAYSFDEGLFHFVHVHYHASFENNKVGLRNSFEWLANDLENASAHGKHSVIFSHSAQGLNPALESVVIGKGVRAIFAGHSHRCLMRRCEIPTVLDMVDVYARKINGTRCNVVQCGGFSGMATYLIDENSVKGTSKRNINQIYVDEKGDRIEGDCPNPPLIFINSTDNTLLCKRTSLGAPVYADDIPIFWSGSSSFQTFLKATFSPSQIVVSSYTSVGGKATKYLDAFEVPNSVYPYYTEEDIADFIINL